MYGLRVCRLYHIRKLGSVYGAPPSRSGRSWSLTASWALLAKGFGLAAPFWFAAASVAVMTAVAWRAIGNGAEADARRGADRSA